MAKENIVYENCPHCGEKLSPWQQVLLSVDRSLMCKHCWYRIFLDRKQENNISDKKSTNNGDEK